MPRPRFEAWNWTRPSYHSLPVPSQSKRHQSRFLRFRTAHLEFCNASPACRILSEDHGLKAQHVVSTWLESFTACSKHDRKKTPNNPVLPPLVITGSPALNLTNAMVDACGDFWSQKINPGSSPFSIFSKFFNHFSWVFGDYGFKPRRNSEISSFHQTSWSLTRKLSGFPQTFHPLNILPASGCVDCVAGLSHNAVWRSCIHKDVRDCGGLATWMNVAGGSKISQRSQSIAINTITAIRTIDSTNCAQIYLDWLGYFMKTGGIK